MVAKSTNLPQSPTLVKSSHNPWVAFLNSRSTCLSRSIQRRQRLILLALECPLWTTMTYRSTHRVSKTLLTVTNRQTKKSNRQIRRIDRILTHLQRSRRMRQILTKAKASSTSLNNLDKSQAKSVKLIRWTLTILISSATWTWARTLETHSNNLARWWTCPSLLSICLERAISLITSRICIRLSTNNNTTTIICLKTSSTNSTRSSTTTSMTK